MPSSHYSTAVCCYEWFGGRQSTYWQNIGYIPKDHYDAIQEWKAANKRLTPRDIARTGWIKKTDTGRQFMIGFYENGTLFEASFEDPDDEWSGDWEIDNGVLVFTIGRFKTAIFFDGERYRGVEIEEPRVGFPTAYITLEFVNQQPDTP